jgi:hypothetical protein
MGLTRRARRSVAVATAAVLVVLVGGGALVARRGADSAHERRSAATAPSNLRTEASPASAAVSFVAASQDWLYQADSQVADDVRQRSAPKAAERLVDASLRDLVEPRRELASSSGTVWWIVRPLATRIDRSAQRAAEVRVWTVTVLSAPGVAVPQSQWTTAVVDLTRPDQRWLVERISYQPGPTPRTGPEDQPWDALALDRALEGYVRLGSGGR